MSKTNRVIDGFISLDPVSQGDWLIKVSKHRSNIMVFVHNRVFHWSCIRLFGSEPSAKNWVDYLLLQGNDLQ